jgi:hypothetical protein
VRDADPFWTMPATITASLTGCSRSPLAISLQVMDAGDLSGGWLGGRWKAVACGRGWPRCQLARTRRRAGGGGQPGRMVKFTVAGTERWPLAVAVMISV